ncbi:hypothetical protein CC79DRAFT_811233 [Sarocladium strictum]
MVNQKTKNGKYTSKRTQPLQRLPQAIRLRTIDLYLHESAKGYMRRGHEPRAVIRYMKDITHRQPSMRLMRSLQTIQGMDCFQCLRGLDHIRAWDFLKDGTFQLVRDLTFLSNLNRTVITKPQVQDDVNRRIRNLALSPSDYQPTPEDFAIVEMALGDADASTGDWLPTPTPTPSPSVDSDSSDDSDDDSGSGSPNLGVPHGNGNNGGSGTSARRPSPHLPTPDSTGSPDQQAEEDDGDEGDDEDEGSDDDDDDADDGEDHAMSFALDEDNNTETDEQALSDAEVIFTGRRRRTIVYDLTGGDPRGDSLQDPIVLADGDEEEAAGDVNEGALQHTSEDVVKNEVKDEDMKHEGEEEQSLFVEDDSRDEIPTPKDESSNTPEPQNPSAEGGDIASGVLSPDVVSEHSFSPGLAHGTPASSNGNRKSSSSGSPPLWVSPPPAPAAQGSRPNFTSPTNSARPSRPETLNTPSRSPPQQTESPNLFTSPGSNESSPSHSSSNGFSPEGFARGVLDRVQGSSPLAEGGDGTRAGSRESPIEIDEEPSSVHRTPRCNMVRRHGFQMSTSPTDMLRDMTLSSIQSRLLTSSTPQDADADQTDPNVVRQGDPRFRSPFWRQRASMESSAASGSPKRARQEREDVEMKDEDGDDDEGDKPSPKRARDSLRKDNWEPDRDGDSFME